MAMGRKWTTGEDAVLASSYGHISCNQIANTLNRSVSSIHNRAQKIGVRIRQPRNAIQYPKTGSRYGDWTVIRPAESKHGQRRAFVVCQCGTRRIVFLYLLIGGYTKSCVQCAGVRSRKHRYPKVGDVVGRFTVLGNAPTRRGETSKRFYVACQCGTIQSATIQGIKKHVTCATCGTKCVKNKVPGKGERFGSWTIRTGEETRRGRERYVEVVCDCSNTSFVSLSSLLNGRTTMCKICSGRRVGKVVSFTTAEQVQDAVDRKKAKRREWRKNNRSIENAAQRRNRLRNPEANRKRNLRRAIRKRARLHELAVLQQQLDLLSIKGFLESCLPSSNDQTEPPQK